MFLLARFNSNGDTARFGLVPFLAVRAQLPIERANGADRAIIRFGTVLGPPPAPAAPTARGAQLPGRAR